MHKQILKTNPDCLTFRSSDQRLALADHVTKRLSLRTGTDDTVVNFFATNGYQVKAQGEMSKIK